MYAPSPSPSAPPEPHGTHAIPGSPRRIRLRFCFSETLVTLLSCLFSLLKILTSSANVRADTGSVGASLPVLWVWHQTWQCFSVVHLRPELPEPSDFTSSCIYIYIYLSFYPPWHHPPWCGENLGKFVHLHAQKSRNNSRSSACDLFFKNGTLMRDVTRGQGLRSGLPDDACGFLTSQKRWSRGTI